MQQYAKALYLFVYIALTVLAAGCGSKPPAEVTESSIRHLELDEIRQMYKLHQTDKGRPPSKLADFKPYEPGFTNGFQSLRDGRCIAIWGINLANESDGSSQVIAYEKDAPAQGGEVVLKDGTLKKMTADELQALIKPSK